MVNGRREVHRPIIGIMLGSMFEPTFVAATDYKKQHESRYYLKLSVLIITRRTDIYFWVFLSMKTLQRCKGMIAKHTN